MTPDLVPSPVSHVGQAGFDEGRARPGPEVVGIDGDGKQPPRSGAGGAGTLLGKDEGGSHDNVGHDGGKRTRLGMCFPRVCQLGLTLMGSQYPLAKRSRVNRVNSSDLHDRPEATPPHPSAGRVLASNVCSI